MPHDFYVSWAALYEGPIDEAYLGQLIPRLMGEIVLNCGNKNVTIPPDPAVTLQRRTVEEVAREACAARDAFHIVFVHADTGGRGQEVNLELRSTQYCEAMTSCVVGLRYVASPSRHAMKRKPGCSPIRMR